jgi:DNA-binding transcriptional LysR family regulator
MSLCHEAGFEPLVSQEVGDAITGVALAAGGFGVCLIPESATSLALPGVVYKPITGLPSNATVDLSFIYRNDDRSPILQAFLGVVDEVQLGLHKTGTQ